jgi:hypothetical protein
MEDKTQSEPTEQKAAGSRPCESALRRCKKTGAAMLGTGGSPFNSEPRRFGQFGSISGSAEMSTAERASVDKLSPIVGKVG